MSILGYLQPGDKNYQAPDAEFAKSLTLEDRLKGGYALTPEQIASLDPMQQMNRFDHIAQGVTGGPPIDKYGYQGIGFGSWNPEYKDLYTSSENPNAIYRKHGIATMGRNLLLGAIAAGLGSAALGSLGGGAGAGAASSSTIPGLTGLSGTGTAAGAFPLTTMAPTALEAGLFPLTTTGVGSTAGLGALGAGASALDLSNVTTQSTIPQTEYITWENANNLRKGLGEINQATAQPPQQQSGGGLEIPYIPYDTDAPVNFNEDTGVRFAVGGPVSGGLESLTAMNKGGYLDGPGDGMSDSIPATIEGEQPAALADGEYVLSADVVSHIGNGSSKAGAKKLDGMMANIRKARTGTTAQGKQIDPDKFLPA